jgi:UDP-N-acetylglucosamine--N-acetylmuramyl-(pentapeptide) pyrophosphoryl-undecaprenol N-acetylglucosamine transferase
MEGVDVKLLICGGGTGGHIYPALAAVVELQQIGLATTDFLWIGTEGQVEESLVPRAGLALETIQGGAIAGVSLKTKMINAAKLVWSVGKANRLMADFRPDVLFMTGGYVNAPVALAAWLRRIPAAIYLPDIEPGMAIKALSRFAKRVACTADASSQFFPTGKTVTTGYPVRPELRAAVQFDQETALAKFDLLPERPTLFVFGGSRGARSINRAVMAALPHLLEIAQVIHISGTLDWAEVEAHAETLPESYRPYYRPFPYLHEEMAYAYRAADLILARAGASALGEFPAFGLPSILVPYPYAWRYQKVNADYLVSRGAAVRLNDEDLAAQLLPVVREILENEEERRQMAQAARELDMPDSAGKLARLLIGLGKEG